MRLTLALAFVCASVASPIIDSNAAPEPIPGSKTSPDPPGITLNAFGQSCHFVAGKLGECHPVHADNSWDPAHMINLPQGVKGKPGITTIYIQQQPQPTPGWGQSPPSNGWGQSPPPSNGWGQSPPPQNNGWGQSKPQPNNGRPGQQSNDGWPRQGSGGW